MGEKFAGLIKISGICLLLIGLWIFLSVKVTDNFLAPNNIENLLRRTALYGILGIGVAFVIISSGIDLSIGSLVCMAACFLGLFLKVDYVSVGTTSVWEVRAESKTLLVHKNHGYQTGDYLWYDKDRRNRALLKIESIEETDGKSKLVVEGDLKRDQFSEPNTPVASVSRAFKIEAVEESKVKLDDRFPKIDRKDRIVFVSPATAGKERVVEQPVDSGWIQLNEPLSGVDTTFLALPVKRTPLMSIPMAILSVIGISAAIGLIHGLLVARLNLQPFVVTLCGLMIYRGISRSLTSNQTIGFSEHTETLGKIATGRWVIWQGTDASSSFGIPYSFFVFAGFVIFAMVLLNLTVWGRHLQAVGRNAEAARYSGINTKRITLGTYLICSVLAGIGGMMFAIDSSSIAPTAFGNFFELYAIAAAVLGGCSLRGGEGSILGVVIGTALMQTLYNAIVLLKIPDENEFTIIGGVILLGVLADEFLHRTMKAR